MSSSIFHKDLLVVPPEATFGPKNHSDDFILSHRLKKIFPENNTPVGENSSIRFHLYGAGQHLDTRSVRLFFTANINSTLPYTSKTPSSESEKKFNNRLAVAPIRFNDWIGSLFKTLEVRLNNQTLISRIDSRNILHHVVGLYTVNQTWRRSSSGQNEGYLNSLAYRNIHGNLVESTSWQKALISRRPIQYCIEFDLENIFKTQKYIPMDMVRSLDIELTTEYNVRAITRDHTNLGYGLANVNTKTLYDPFVKAGSGYLNRSVFNDMQVGSDNSYHLTEGVQTDREIKNIGGTVTGTTQAKNLHNTVSIANRGTGWYNAQIAAGYTIKDYYITADFYQFNDAYRATLEQALMETGITLDMEGFLNISEALPTSTRHEVRIRRTLTSVKSLYICFELDKLVRSGVYPDPTFETGTSLNVSNKPQYFSDGLSTFERFGLKSYQILLNGVPVQGHEINCLYNDYGSQTVHSILNAEHIMETLKSFSTHGNHLVTGTDLSSNKYGVDDPTPLGSGAAVGTGGVAGSGMYDKGTITIADGAAAYTASKVHSDTNIAILRGGDYLREGVYHTTDSHAAVGVNKSPFVLGVNLEKSSQVSGSSMQEITILLNWAESSPEGLTCHSFLSYDQHLEIKPGFEFVLHE